jgi:hypothetical protein
MLWGLLGLLVIVIGLKSIPPCLAHLQFKNSVTAQCRIMPHETRYAETLRDIICRDGQRLGAPLDRDQIKVDMDSPETRASADSSAPIDLYFFQPRVPVHIQYPEYRQTALFIKLQVISVIGLVLGVGWFFKGLLIFRKYRAVADTPLASIRGIPMGLVQVRGKAIGQSTLLSPVSRLPCFLYKVTIDRSDGDGRWSQHRTDSAWVNFFLEDETGRVAVQPRGAEIEIEPSGQCQISKRPPLMVDAWEPEQSGVSQAGFVASDSELRDYVARVEGGVRTGHFQAAGSDFPASVESEQSKRSSGLMQGSRFLSASFLVPTAVQFGGYDRNGGLYRLTEQCIEPDRSYDVTGTCSENPAPANDGDLNVITKGRNADTFVISNRDDKQLEEFLHTRALRHIWGGGLLAVGCAAALLQSLRVL